MVLEAPLALLGLLGVLIPLLLHRMRNRELPHVVLPTFALGGSYALTPRWRAGAELLHVPMDVRRDPQRASQDDAFTGLRLRLDWRR